MAKGTVRHLTLDERRAGQGSRRPNAGHGASGVDTSTRQT